MKKLIIILFILGNVFVVLGQTNSPRSSLPANIAGWKDKNSDELLNNSVIKTRLKKLLGKKNYAEFLESFETINPVIRKGNFLFSKGCLIHACGYVESAIAIDLVNKTIHAGIFREGKKNRYFNEQKRKTPELSKKLKRKPKENDLMKQFILLTILVAGVGLNVLAQKNTSVYTNLDDKSCKTLESDTSGAGWYRGRCPGISGYKLDLLEGDIRQTINVITPSNKTFELNFWGYFGAFSSVGAKAEWRMKGKTPIALIVRFNVSNPEDSSKNTSYLMVSKITNSEVCVTDIVNPSKTQNAQAQALADKASTKSCKAIE